MTRLKPGNIKNIPGHLEAYDHELLQKTGHTLRGIACHALGIEEKGIFPITDPVLVGIVPIKSGQGVIEGFSDAVKHIVRHIGFNTFVTRAEDVAGIAEAVEKGANVVMMADDHRFVALNVKHGRVVDNAEATGKGFVAGLDLMVGGLNGQKVLVIGGGPVGRCAALAAVNRGAEVSVFDIDLQRSHQLAKKLGVTVEQSLENALLRYHLLIEATNAADVIDDTAITPKTYIVAPGMPLGLTPAAAKKISHQLLHDPLQTGAAVMVVDAAISMSYKKK
jgi:pyrrolysine biosynthesis protein PylD